LFSILPIMVPPWHSVRMTVLADALLAFIEVGDPGATEPAPAPGVEPDQEWVFFSMVLTCSSAPQSTYFQQSYM